MDNYADAQYERGFARQMKLAGKLGTAKGLIDHAISVLGWGNPDCEKLIAELEDGLARIDAYEVPQEDLDAIADTI